MLGTIKFHLLLLLHIISHQNLNMIQMKGTFLYGSDLKLFVEFMYWLLYQT